MSKLDALYAYQEAELKKAQVENAIRSTPSRQKLNKLHTLLKTQQTIIAKLTEDIDERVAAANRLTDNVKKLEERIDIENSELLTMEQDEETTAEEMTELRGDIERLNREVIAVAKEAKTLLAELDKATEEYQKTRATAAKAKKEYDALRIVCEKERDDSADELKACDAELEKLAKDVEAELLARYNKVKMHNAVPLAKIVNNKCGGCNMSLPMAVIKKVSASDTIIECENCGRILLPEE